MQHLFPLADLAFNHRKTRVMDARVEIAVGTADRKTPHQKNPFLNGKLRVTGSFRYECPPNTCPLRKFKPATLTLREAGRWTVLPIFLLDLPIQGIKTVGPHWKSYEWPFIVVEPPPTDMMSLIPQGEIASLDDLKEFLSIGLGDLEEVCFTSEGGFRLLGSSRQEP